MGLHQFWACRCGSNRRRSAQALSKYIRPTRRLIDYYLHRCSEHYTRGMIITESQCVVGHLIANDNPRHRINAPRLRCSVRCNHGLVALGQDNLGLHPPFPRAPLCSVFPAYHHQNTAPPLRDADLMTAAESDNSVFAVAKAVHARLRRG